MHRLSWALLLSLTLAGPAAAADGCPTADPSGEPWVGERAWSSLEAAGYRLGRIDVEVLDVYEDRAAWYARAANYLHLDTHERVVREHLVVASGEAVDARRIHESERALRALGIFREATLAPLTCHDGVVDVRATVKDAWTLIFSVKANQVGGQTSTGLRIEDRNFLGSGKEVFVESANDPTRSSIAYAYQDPALFGSHWRLYAEHSDQSDGRTNQAELELPFLSTRQRWGFEAAARDRQQTLTFYQDGAEAWRADVADELQRVTAWRLIAGDGVSGWRVGAGLRSEHRSYGAPVAIDPTLRAAPGLDGFRADGITVAVSRFHDDYASYRNLKLVDRIEDYDLGFDATFAYTFEPGAFGDLGAEGQRVDLDLAWGGRAGADGLVLATLESSGRKGELGWFDGYLSAEVSWYQRTAPHVTRLARLAVDLRDDPAPEHEIPLGGEAGLLGYPAQVVVGDRAWRLHLEDRRLSELVLFQTLRVGYSVVVEAGRARRIDDGRWSPLLADVGVGLRLGNLRGAYGQVLYIMVFKPLVDAPGSDGSLQFVVGDVISF